MSTDKYEEIFMFGERLREERNRLGLSQAVLGVKLQTTGRTIAKYESNETQPRLRQLVLLGSLGADLNYILTGVKSEIVFAESSSDRDFSSTDCGQVVKAFDRADSNGRNLLITLANYILNTKSQNTL